MGVRGLTTYIATNHRKYLKNYQLRDCYIIIDGSSLAYNIYEECSRAHCAFGGDYDRYAQNLREFFNLLSQCNIKPIVILDGGYESRKVGTVIRRMNDRIKAISYVQPTSQNRVIIYPLLMKTIVKEVLKEMGIPFVQCDYEADQEIAAVAKKYNCPVLSNDSDFYIFDVSYIPIRTLERYAIPVDTPAEGPCQQFFIKCNIYKVDFFLNSFGGLDKSMLPLLATLLGNDYVKIKVFSKFYSQFKLPKKKHASSQKRIARLIEWMRNETFDSAIQRVLGRMKVARHVHVKRSIMRAVNAYTGQVNTIEQYLPSAFTCTAVLQNSVAQINSNILTLECGDNTEVMDVDGNDDNHCDNNAQLSDVDSSSDEDKDDEEAAEGDCMDVEMTKHISNIQEIEKKRPIKIPAWLTDNSRKGNLESCIFDILTLRTYFALPQSEDNFYSSSHSPSIPLLKKICKLLLGDHSQDISIWMRNRNGQVQRFLLHLVNTSKFADVEIIPAISSVDRRSLLLQCLDIPNDFCVDEFPDEWKLYICAIIMWIKNTTEPQITDSHVISLLMSMIALTIVDSKVGFYRKKIGFLKSYGKKQKRIIKEAESVAADLDECDKDNGPNINNLGTNCESKTIRQLHSLIDTDECVASFNGFYQCHQLNENLTGNKNFFSKRTIHSFAQFQSCLYHVSILNSLLGEPLEKPIISKLYSGTFIYNMCCTLSKVKNTTEYIQSLLKYSPNILKLVESMFLALKTVVKITTVQPEVRRNKRRRKSKAKVDNTSDDDVDCEENIDEPLDTESYHDENNPFSLLSTV